jgi:alkyldihydroxyacetonephosphate synthase
VRISVLYDAGSNEDKYFSKAEAISKRIGVQPDNSWDGHVDVPDLETDPKLKDILKELIPDEKIKMNPADRLMHSFGKSSVEILKLRLGIFPEVVDAVIFPGKDDLVNLMKKLDHKKVLMIPFGGGTNVNGSLDITSSRKKISLDTKNLRNLEVHQNYVMAGSGFTGKDVENELNQKGLTIGNFPESFYHSTLGGWVATKATGQESNQYGGIENLVLGVNMATSEGMINDQVVPRNSYPLDMQRMSLGAEGKTGLVTDLYIKKIPITSKRHYGSFMFRTYKEGINALSQMKKFPSVARLSDEVETSLSLEGEFHGIAGNIFEKYLNLRKVRNGSMLILVNNDSRISEKPVSGVYSTKIPAKKWFEDRYSRPALGNLLWKKGFIPDTLETATTWDKLYPLHSSVREEFNKTMAEWDAKGIIMSHLSHMYESGACIYFTYVLWKEKEQLDLLLDVRDRLIKSFSANGAAITHHHGSGEYFRKYLDPGLEKRMDSMKDPLFSGE